jgi:hypothetical protein
MPYKRLITIKLLNITIRFNNDIYETAKMSFVNLLVGGNRKKLNELKF